MLRVLHVIPNFGPGGAERLVVDLIKFIDHTQFEGAACSLYPRQGYPLEKELDMANIKVWYLNKHTGPDLRIIFELVKVLTCFSPHIVHTHLSVLKYLLPLYVIKKVPVRVHTIHNQPEHEVDKLGQLIHKIAFKHYGVIPVSISESVYRGLKPLYGNINSQVIYNGIDTKRFNVPFEQGFNIKKRVGVIHKKTLIHIGRFYLEKNHSLLIDSFKLVKRYYENVVLLLVGDGELRTSIKKKVYESGLEGSIRFLGVRDDVPDLLAAADCFVLSSDWEGFGLVVVEAMAAGKPVVATAVGSVPELVQDGVTGFLVPSHDPDALAEAIIKLLNDDELMKSMGKNAEKAAQKFNIYNTAKCYETLYCKALEVAVGDSWDDLK